MSTPAETKAEREAEQRERLARLRAIRAQNEAKAAANKNDGVPPPPDEATLKRYLDSLPDEQLRLIAGATEQAYQNGVRAGAKSKPNSGLAGAALDDAWHAVALARRANLKNNPELYDEAEERLNTAFAELEAEMSSTEADKAFIRGTDKDEDIDDDDETDFDDDDDDDDDLDLELDTRSIAAIEAMAREHSDNDRMARCLAGLERSLTEMGIEV
jgi:hypothetical protein